MSPGRALTTTWGVASTERLNRVKAHSADDASSWDIPVNGERPNPHYREVCSIGSTPENRVDSRYRWLSRVALAPTGYSRFMGRLHRFWLEFDLPEVPPPRPRVIRTGWSLVHNYLGRGCGVTARDLDDALGLVQEVLLLGESLPPLLSMTADVDVSSLDARTVLPHIGTPVWSGVWFPAATRSGPVID